MKTFNLCLIIQLLKILHVNSVAEDLKHLNDEVNLSWRLPQTIYPIAYHIELETKVHDKGNRDYSGFVIITLDVREATNQIVLHSKELDIEEVLVFTSFGTLDSNHYLDPANDFLIINISESLEPGNDLTLSIWFKGQLQLEGVGFYRSEYKINNETRYLATTQFEAPHARYAFPVFDGM